LLGFPVTIGAEEEVVFLVEVQFLKEQVEQVDQE
jgi:hypothetical protein